MKGSISVFTAPYPVKLSFPDCYGTVADVFLDTGEKIIFEYEIEDDA